MAVENQLPLSLIEFDAGDWVLEIQAGEGPQPPEAVGVIDHDIIAAVLQQTEH